MSERTDIGSGNSSAGAETATGRLTLGDRLLGWREIMQTANAPESRPLDGVGKWLVMTRAAVFPMTVGFQQDRAQRGT